MRLPKDLLSGTYTKPRIFLCEADKERICQLETTNTSATLKFNSYSEISFEVGRTYNNKTTGETLVNPYYDKIEAVRLIEVEGIGYFEIQGPELISDGIKEAKNVTANSLEYTLLTKYLSDLLINTGAIGSIEVTEAENRGDIDNIRPVTLCNKSDPALSLLHIALKDVYGWSVGHVDDSIATQSRSFEIDRVSVYDFLMNDVCEKFNCYIVFDTVDNEINVYAESLTSKFIGDGETTSFTISPPFYKVGTVSVDGYKTTLWQYTPATGEIVLDEAPADGAQIEVVDGALTEWETDVFVSFNNLSQEINVNYDADSIKTKLTVTYGDDGDIREVNLGLPYLTDISYYYNVDWMGKELYDAYTSYIKNSNRYQKDYTNNAQEILKLNDQIYYEETRLSLEYSLVQSVGPTTVGTYYVKQTNADGSSYYKEVSLPGAYVAGANYYSNATANVTEEKVSALYSVLKKYFNNENADDNSGYTPITSWETDLGKLGRDFAFMETYTITYLSTQLSKVTKNRIGNTTAEGAINNFLSEVWSELGRTPLQKLYLEPYKTIQDINIEDGWSNKSSDKYAYYYPVTLVIASIEGAIKKRDKKIGEYETSRQNFYDANENIRNQLAMDQNFTPKQLTRLSAFLREDELHLDDIVETSQDDLSSSFKVKQDAMESGRIELQKLCQPQLQFSMTMANIYALPEFEPIIDQFQLGKVIKVELRPNYIKQSRLLQVNINFDDFSDFSCEFGELTDIRSQSEIHADLLKNAITAGKSVATNSSRWTKGADSATAVDLKIQQGLLDAATQIKAIDGSQGVVIDKYGIHLQKTDHATGEVDPKQGWIVNNQFLFSDDGFKSTKSVFGEFTYDGQTHYGILANSLVGSLIIGSQINLENKDKSMTFGADGFYVKNSTHSFNIDPANDKSIVSLSNGSENLLSIDSSGALNIKGKITATSLTLSGCTVSTNDISGLSTVATSGKYSDLTGKPPIPKTVADLGFDTSNVVYKGDITQTTKKDGNGISYVETTVPTSSGTVKYATYDAGDYIVFGRSKGTNSAGKNYVCISTDGLLTARNALIYGTVYATDGEFAGKITSTEGDIGGWTIGSGCIYKNTYNSDSNTTYAAAVRSNATHAFAVYQISGENEGAPSTTGGWTRNFSVSYSGKLYSNNAEITGDITAKSLTLDGCTVPYTKVSGTPDLTVYIQKGGTIGTVADGSTGIKISTAGLLQASNAVIYGTIHASAGNIGGWSISKLRMISGDPSAGTGTLASGSSSYSPYAFAAGTPAKSDGTSPDYGNAKFRVRHSGELYATSADITGHINATSGEFTGKITASTGEIGGWTIDGSKLYAGWVWDSSTNKFTRSGTGLSATTYEGDPAFYAGFQSKYGKNPWLHMKNEEHTKNWTEHAKFYVTNAGKLYAENAEIAGKVTATSGSFTGEITATSGDFSNSITIGGTSITAGNLRKLYRAAAGNTGDDTYQIKRIEATSGEIGGWTINTSRILTQSGNAEFYLASATSTGYNNWIVAKDADGNTTFKVAKSNGAVTTTRGSIGGWNITSTYLYSTYTENNLMKTVELDVDKVSIHWNVSGGGSYDQEKTWYAIIDGGSGSDIRLKDNVYNIDNAYEQLFDDLKPKTFNYKASAKMGSASDVHFGFVAQDILESQSKFGLDNLSIVYKEQYYGIVRQELIALNTWQIQKAKARITDLESRIEQLEKLLGEKGEK